VLERPITHEQQRQRKNGGAPPGNLIIGYVGYGGANEGSFSDNLPDLVIALSCLGGSKPSVPDQNFNRVCCGLSIAEGARAVDADVACADDRFVPFLQLI